MMRTMNGNKLIIGFAGKKRSGKDTAASTIQEHYPQAERMAFADPMKECLRHLYGLTDQQLNGDLKETVDDAWGTTPRKLMQQFGTEFVKRHSPAGQDHWVRLMQQRVAQSDSNFIVITDVRYPNEAEWVQSMGGLVLEIVRDEVEQHDTHSSERRLPENLIDCIVPNNQDIECFSSLIHLMTVLILSQRVNKRLLDI